MISYIQSSFLIILRLQVKKMGTTRDQRVRPVKNPRGLLNRFLARSFLITLVVVSIRHKSWFQVFLCYFREAV